MPSVNELLHGAGSTGTSLKRDTGQLHRLWQNSQQMNGVSTEKEAPKVGVGVAGGTQEEEGLEPVGPDHRRS